MAVPVIKNAFTTGEIAPSMYGRTDLERYASAASTMRNMFVSYRGGAYSRAGTAFVGYSKQTGFGAKPRLIPFQFSINQGLALEFGGAYMRVIDSGAYVTESALNITGITQANPCVVSATTSGTQTATPANSGVISSYAPGDGITLAGGTYTIPTELSVLSTELLYLGLTAPGSGYVPGDTINLSGGTQTSAAQAQVATTMVATLPSIVNAGTGGTVGNAVVTGTTGAGTKFQANVTISAVQSASPNVGSVTSSYAPGDTITLAGGTYTTPAVVSVTYTILHALTTLNAGSGYVPADTITLSGGATTLAPVATVATTKVSALPTIAAGGSGGTAGTAVVSGTTGTGTKFQANVTIAGGAITSVNSLVVAGAYTVNPTTLNNEPVTGGGLTGAALSLVMGVNTVTFSAGGNFSANPASNTLTQAGTSGAGVGATFTGVFAPGAVSFTSYGSYTAFPSNPVAQGATSGSGFGVTLTVSTVNKITAVNSLVTGGAYTVNPTAPGAEPVTGGGLTGAQLGLTLGIALLSISQAGAFSANPGGGVMTQSATSGVGTGATFGSAILGPLALGVINAGSYSVVPSNPVSQASSTGGGEGAEFNLTSGAMAPFNNGDWVYIEGVGGMTELNGRTFVVGNAGTGGFSLYDVFERAINSTGYSAYTGGGTAARIYTLTTPYAAVDLPYLKFTQSADVMSLCCVNQETATEYAPYELTRLADNNWTIAPANFGSAVATPKNVVAIRQNDDGGAQVYVIYYAVTAVNPVTGEESVPSIEIQVGNEALGTPNGSGDTPSNIITWSAVAGATSYNVYKETPQPLPTGSTLEPPPPTFVLGLIGQTQATSFTDTGEQPDFATVPPQHQNPFARGAIIAANVTRGGSGYYTNAQSSSIVNSSTGSGAEIIAATVNPAGIIGSLVILNGGSNYTQGDTLTVVGSGSGAAGTLTVGPKTGTYPGTVTYFQERRVYGASLNNPDTYWMSKPGLYLNFDTSYPSVASDAITGSPWATEVNGIQWMINMPGGLVVLTGLGAWQLTGAGGSSLNPQPVTPADEQVQPQAYNGCSAVVPPIKIDASILYVQAKGSIYREFTYQYFQNIYTGVDLTELASHLFTGYTIEEHAYCEEPYKVLWAVRDDGVLLSLTYLKEEQVTGWARHDTNGLFLSCCTITEPPVDALYVVTQRTINGLTAYMVERMNDRIWFEVEDAWCVDCALQMPQTTPDATLACSSPLGSGTITAATVTAGGSGYSIGTYAVIFDDNGEGIGGGATLFLVISNGVITSADVASGGFYYANPQVTIIDPANTGSGAAITLTLSNSATLSANAPVFSSSNVGSIVRMGGGIAEITAYLSPEVVTANILVPITQVYPNSATPSSLPVVISQPAGSWTLTEPTTIVGGLYHLIGAYVTGLADGNPIEPQMVASDGTITLPVAASSIVVGLGYTAQLQTPYFDAGEKMLSQGRRKRITAATVRVELSRGLQMGANQPDGASLSPIQVAPAWSDMDNVPDRRAPTYNGLAPALYTGDIRIPIKGDNDTRGQVALQQVNALPMTVLAAIPEILEADVEAGKSGSQPAGGGSANTLGTGFYAGNPPLTIAFSNPPSVTPLNTPTVFNGTVFEPGNAVQIAISSSGTVVPTSGWVPATVTNVTWTGDLTFTQDGNYYVWAQQTNNPEIFAVTPLAVGNQVVVFLTQMSGVYTVPANFQPSRPWAIYAIGGGGAGIGDGALFIDGPGGGGGAYAQVLSSDGHFSLSAGQNVHVSVGLAVDSWFNVSANAPPTSVSQGVLAKAGTSATYNNPSPGGQASSCIGSLCYSGGAGGVSGGNYYNGAGGGGGAAGPSGNGQNGGNGVACGANSGGCGGGGGANGGFSSVGQSNTQIITGGGGAGFFGNGGGDPSGSPAASNGGGGAGASPQGGIPTGGAMQVLWTQTSDGAQAGPSGGSGGEGTRSNYGGGDGGTGSGPGTGSQGIIVFEYFAPS
jgi:hypothetical protein